MPGQINKLKNELIITVACLLPLAMLGQELEPRVYANLPKGLNAVAFLYGLSKGNVLTEPTLPVENFKITAHNLGLGYVRTFALANKLSRVQFTIPFLHMMGALKLNGRDTSGTRTGFGDMRIRFGINLLGSEALSPKDFAKYQQKTILGVSLVTSVPTGLYYRDKRINLGSNRWGFKPEIGVSRRFKRFYVEGYSGVWIYTNNTKFLESKTLTQDPVLTVQSHINYTLNKKMWLGVNGNWFRGGKTKADGDPVGNLKDNWRIGGIWSYAMSRQHSLKLQFHVGAFTDVGYDYSIVIIGYQYVFF